MARLLIYDTQKAGAKVEREVDLDGTLSSAADGRAILVIGRSPQCDVVLDDPSLSRRHARIEKTDERRWRISDLGSTAGVVVNGRPMQQRLLERGDKVRLGNRTLEFRDP